jgi:hypothetical protein
MNTRALRCLLTPPFHHDWKLADNIDQERQSPFVLGDAALRSGWSDPQQREFREYQMRCARCGAEQWWNYSESPLKWPHQE